MMETKKPKCKLTGTDGNVYAIMGTVRRSLVKAGLPDQATEFVTKAMQSSSYDAVLQLCFHYVEVR